MSQIITFYSYKGGVGRSLALVNVATLLSKWGKKVLMIDWDLEAPGLENFFEPYIKNVDWSKQKGILDFLWAKQKKQSAPWQDWVVPINTKVSSTPLHLLVSGKSNGGYSDQLRTFNVSRFYKDFDGARVIEDFRNSLLDTYDFVLIDSRTGVTDFGGICTIQMPDILVMLLTATEQGLNGTAKIAEKAQAAHASLPFDREKLLIMPVPARIDQSEYTLTQEWLNKIAAKLKPFYEDWIPSNIDINEFMRLIKVPYIPYFSYGEKLPVIEQGVSDPAGLGYAYENLGMLIGKGLNELDEFVERREAYLEEVSGEKPTMDLQRKSLNDMMGTVRIFISYADKDSLLKETLINKIYQSISNKNIEFSFRETPSLGQNRINVMLSKISMADVIIFIITDNYFIESDNVVSGALIASEVLEEFNLIKRYDSTLDLIVPIYLTPKYSQFFSLNIFSVRQGIDATDVYAYDPIEYAKNQLLPVLEQKLKEKKPKAIYI